MLFLSLLFFTFTTNVSAYPGSGQGKAQNETIQIVDPMDLSKITENGALVNPLHDVEQYVGTEAIFGGNCLTCHGGENGANSPEHKFHNQITYDLIRVADGKSMKQDDGSLLFEIDPNGGIVKYKLIVGLSKDVYDGGKAGGYHISIDQTNGEDFSNAVSIDGKDFRALAGWHFSLPQAVKMDLPYCMHIMEEGMSKIYEQDPNRVFSDIKIAVDPNMNFESATGILQIIAGTQKADPHFMKSYGTVIVKYQLTEGLPLEENIAYDSLPNATAADNMVFIEHTVGDDEAIATMGTGIIDDSENPLESVWEPGPLFYGIIIALIIGFLIFGFLKKGRIS